MSTHQGLGIVVPLKDAYASQVGSGVRGDRRAAWRLVEAGVRLPSALASPRCGVLSIASRCDNPAHLTEVTTSHSLAPTSVARPKPSPTLPATTDAARDQVESTGINPSAG